MENWNWPGTICTCGLCSELKDFRGRSDLFKDRECRLSAKSLVGSISVNRNYQHLFFLQMPVHSCTKHILIDEDMANKDRIAIPMIGSILSRANHGFGNMPTRRRLSSPSDDDNSTRKKKSRSRPLKNKIAEKISSPPW